MVFVPVSLVVEVYFEIEFDLLVVVSPFFVLLLLSVASIVLIRIVVEWRLASAVAVAVVVAVVAVVKRVALLLFSFAYCSV